MSRPRIVYLVSRFPKTSETFIVRELDALARTEEFDVELRSLFRSPDTTVHDIAAEWTERVERPRVATVLKGLFWALRKHPYAVSSAANTVLLEHVGRPGILLRALITVAVACAHARQLEERGSNTHVHAHYASYPALAAWICHRLTGVGYSFTAHAHDLYVDRSMLRRKIADARFVITISDFNRTLLDQLNDRGTPIEVIHCGIDISRYAYRTPEIPAHGPVHALCVASLQEYKGHDVLLKALALGGTNVGRIQLDLIGEGPLQEELRTTASRLGLDDRVRFLGGRDEMYVLRSLSDADLFVLPSVIARNGQMEGLPVVLMEALACGLPTVSTTISGIPEIVIDGVTGYLTEPRNVRELHDALDGIIADGAEAARRASAGRRLVEREFVLDDSVRRLCRLLHAHRLEGGDRRHIALVEFSPSGGLFQFGVQLGEALARAGNEVEIITGPSPELVSREPSCRVRSILPTWHPTAGANAPYWWRRARRAVRAARHTAAWLVLLTYLWRKRPAVVVWSIWRFPIDGWGVQLARKVLPHSILGLIAHEPRPLVEQPGGDQMLKSSRILDRALGRAYEDLDIAFVLGESSKRTLRDAWPISAPVHVIPHGDETIYTSTAVPPVAATSPVVLSFGTITTYKGIDTLCDAWPKVRSRIPDAELVIVGALNPDVDESALREMVSDVEGARLEIGYVAMADVPSYFARARCVVLPYKRASQSGVAHLAHTLRRPVVATRVGDIPSAVRDQVTGLLVEPEDPDALSRAVIRLLGDADLAQRMGDAGAESVKATASWDHVAELLLKGLDGAGQVGAARERSAGQTATRERRDPRAGSTS